MKRGKLVLILIVTTSLLTGCNKSPINLFDYGHKDPVVMENNDWKLKSILEGIAPPINQEEGEGVTEEGDGGE